MLLAAAALAYYRETIDTSPIAVEVTFIKMFVTVVTVFAPLFITLVNYALDLPAPVISAPP